MDNKTIELHTIVTFQGKEYELENLLNGLLNKLEEKDKEIERLNNIIDKAIEYIKSYNIDFENTKFGEAPLNINDLQKLLNILQGEDKDV